MIIFDFVRQSLELLNMAPTVYEFCNNNDIKIVSGDKVCSKILHMISMLHQWLQKNSLEIILASSSSSLLLQLPVLAR